jgi:Lysine methyltransferase
MAKCNKKASLKIPIAKSEPSSDAEHVNKPRNFIVTDATTPVQVAWTGRFRLHHSITVHQTADQETWPGGALWDMGWCMAQLLIGISSSAPTGAGCYQKASSATTHLGKSLIRTVQVPMRVSQALQHHYPHLFARTTTSSRPPIILELGCGVGLTGLVAAAALQARAVVLTDLQIVVHKVTQPNALINTTLEKKKKTSPSSKKASTTAVALPPPAVPARMMIKNAVNTQVVAMP